MPQGEDYLAAEGGVRLFFRKLGSGQRTVVIPNGMYLQRDFERLANRRTLILYDVRNRGQSDTVEDDSKLARGIHNDVDDLEAVRRHFGIDRLDLIGHSYMGLMVILYAMKYGHRVNRIVQIGPTEPAFGKEYPAHLTGADDVMRDVFRSVTQLQKMRGSEDPEAYCRKFWAILRRIYVANESDASRIDWGRCELRNERNSLKYWTERIVPSLQGLNLSTERLASVTGPVMIVHGKRDRSVPYGGARDWATLLPNARLVTVDHAAHAPWIESPDLVFGSIESFLEGAWPESAQKVAAI
jgi:proline iminopeptidase